MKKLLPFDKFLDACAFSSKKYTKTCLIETEISPKLPVMVQNDNAQYREF